MMRLQSPYPDRR